MVIFCLQKDNKNEELKTIFLYTEQHFFYMCTLKQKVNLILKFLFFIFIVYAIIYNKYMPYNLHIKSSLTKHNFVEWGAIIEWI